MNYTRKSTAIVVASKHLLVCESLRALLEKETGFEVPSIFTFSALKSLTPDLSQFNVAVVCVGEEDDIGVVERIRDLSESIRIIVITPGEKLDLQVEAITAGADGVVNPEKDYRLLADAIRRISAGEVWLNERILNRLMPRRRDEPASAEVFMTEELTARETEVLELIGQGLKNKKIAALLHISEATVRHHLSTMYAKLGVDDRLNLVITAFQRGMLNPKSAPAPQHSAPKNQLQSV